MGHEGLVPSATSASENRSAQLRLVSWNVNGLRSVVRKGFRDWLMRASPDIVCLQETKIDAASLAATFESIPGYRSIFNHAVRKGYGGTAVLTRIRPHAVEFGLGGADADLEGRTIAIDFGDFRLLNVYMPHGRRDQSMMPAKLAAFDNLIGYAQGHTDAPLIIAGDFNIASSDLDLARPNENRRNTMFTEQERQKLAELGASGYIDAFRVLHPDSRTYSWWPYAYEARERNIGWRIDRIFIEARLRPKVVDASILTTVGGSDHCPVQLTFAIPSLGSPDGVGRLRR